MPSEAAKAPSAGRFAWLRSQGLGLLCGQATVLLLAIGSLVIVRTRDGASRNVGMDDIRVFFEEPSLTHTWLYLLVAVMGVYALNTLLATIDSVARKWRLGMRRPRMYAAAVIHVGFLLALVAHGVGGIFSVDNGVMVLGPSWQDIPAGRQARLLDITMDTFPNHQPRKINARVEVREAGGEPREVTVGYNAPLSSGFGANLLLLANFAPAMPTARFEVGGAECSAVQGTACVAAGTTVEVGAIHRAGHWGNKPAVMGVITPPEPAEPKQFMLVVGQTERVEGSEPIVLADVAMKPVLVLSSRYAPGNPWALVAAMVLGLGLLLMGRRWL